MATKDVIAHYRNRKGLTQEQLGKAVGVTGRQITRYEAGEQEPTLRVAANIADILGVSLTELAGRINTGPDLSGEWWASWQTWKDDIERIDTHPLHVVQDGDYLILDGERAQGENAIEIGDYAWVGELRFHRITGGLLGWYESNDEGVRTAGSYYFALHPQGQHAIGIWAGLDYDGIVVRGWGALARTQAVAEQQLLAVKDMTGNLRTWPKTT
ncbi:helix-turn-helix transcriptional regulator [Nocardia brasiliensis]|uniref:helix-turn-helix transcriptional regulator n=1 Tax=Nocardia brasiliensis TaxID=37326 RepID=UPI0004A767BE|nr:helix-turn-helix transcriptional regulator [Nocardia brasiliensis]